MKIPSKYKIWRFPLFLKFKYYIKRIFSSNSVCLTYWVNSNVFIWSYRIRPYNWGDYVNLKLAELISGKTIIPSHYYSFDTQISMMGSILPWSMNKNTIVWGSGCLDSRNKQWITVEKPKKILAVRGPLTRKVLLDNGIECPEVYGDPALLFPRYYNPFIEKKYQYGIILHVSTSLSDSIKAKLKSVYGENILFIDPKKFKKWHSFIDDILSCENIISSSLHGIIIADAYKIPNVWVSLTNSEHPDDNFKFKDYFLSVGKNVETPIELFNRGNADNMLQTYMPPTINLDKLLNACPLI